MDKAKTGVKRHTGKQRDLFRGDSDPKMTKEALKHGTSEFLYRNKKGKVRSLLGYIQTVKKDKKRERPEEIENAENGGTEYWRFRR